MNWNLRNFGLVKLDISKALEIFGLVTVIVSLLFVAFELQQANRIAIGTTEYELLRDGNALNQLQLTNPDIRAMLTKARSLDTELTPDERYQAFTWAFTQYAYWAAVVAAHSQGLVSDSFMTGILIDVEENVKFAPGIDFAWQNLIDRGYETDPVLETISETLDSL